MVEEDKRFKVNMSDNGTTGPEIDEGLYSRQLYVLGHAAMKKMAESNVLISGMKGLGIEIAKNVVLCGVKSVTIQDTENTTWYDLSSQFFLRESDIGKNRASASLSRLAELNNYVPVSVNTEPLTESVLEEFQVVVLTNSHVDEQFKLGQFCHDNKIKLIVADTKGLFGKIFCDFGEDFQIVDSDGEQAISYTIQSITKDKEGVVTCIDIYRHGYEDGDYVTFSEIQGMTELNGCEPRKVKVLGPYSFSIGDTSGLSLYVKGGLVTKCKMPKVMKFKSVKDALDSPEFVVTDFAKFDRPRQLHIAFQALLEYVKSKGELPKSRCTTDAEIFVSIAKDINNKSQAKVEELDESLMKEFAYSAKGDLCPVASIIGGIAAQEVMKACSGKFGPINQFLYFDALECLPEENVNDVLSEEACKPQHCRYDGQIAVFGDEFMKKMGKQKFFLVGAGGIGCEMLKNWSMMGLGCDGGKVIVTDMDNIEKTNLNRQFLFRKWDLQKPKSSTAAKAVKEMNPSFNIESHENKVGPDTENLYTDEFFEDIDCITNALDNVGSRMYIDNRCIYNYKPLLESGTLGTKGNVQVVIPHLTESYSSSQDPPEMTIPISDLRYFPRTIDQTLRWARFQFDDLFYEPIEVANQYLTDPGFMEKTLQQSNIRTLEIIKKALVTEKPTDFQDCVAFARNLFQKTYSNSIRELLFRFPADKRISSGELFWSGIRRCPHHIEFDIENTVHLDFIESTANLRAEMYGIPRIRDRCAIKSLVEKMVVPECSLVDADMEVNSYSETLDDELEELKKVIPPADSFKGLKLKPIDFQQDDDSNFHMDFIVACSNLRAENYNILPADRHKSKFIAGKIIPAIVTAKALVTGLACLEVIKLVQGQKKIETYKNGFFNLALPLFTFSEPLAAKKNKYNDIQFTLWDRFEIEEDNCKTMQELLDYFQEKYNLKIDLLSHYTYVLYAFFLTPAKAKERKAMSVREALKKVSRKEIPNHVQALILEMCCTDEDGEDLEVPYIRYILSKDTRS